MDLVDVNVLVFAYRTDAPNHPIYRPWLEEFISGDQAYGWPIWYLVASSESLPTLGCLTRPVTLRRHSPLSIMSAGNRTAFR